MKVFIENEANSNLKNIFNEKTLEYKETITVARAYPFPYGFVLNTTAEDGDNVDVFIITKKKLKRGQIVECEAIGLMEQFEKSWDKSQWDHEEMDHNVLAILKDESDQTITDEIKKVLTDFVSHVFDSIRLNKTRVGRFLGKQEAMQYIDDSKNNSM